MSTKNISGTHSTEYHSGQTAIYGGHGDLVLDVTLDPKARQSQDDRQSLAVWWILANEVSVFVCKSN